MCTGNEWYEHGPLAPSDHLFCLDDIDDFHHKLNTLAATPASNVDISVFSFDECGLRAYSLCKMS